MAAFAYWKAGFVNPIPVMGKGNPVSGYTGIEGANVSWPDIQAWTEDEHATWNIGIRHAGTVGIDVDGPDGAETILKAEEVLGQLPATWSVTARGPRQPRRTYLFRVNGLVDMSRSEGRFRTQFGPQVDIIHRGHRYSIMPPSIHPEIRTPYYWYRPDGSLADATIPALSELAELPAAWVEYLRSRPEPTVAAVADPFEVGPARTFSRSQAQAYCMPALNAFAAMRTPEDYGFNEALNALSVRFGHFVPAFMSDAVASGAIWKAAVKNRSVEFQGQDHVLATIRSGLKRGMAEPYHLLAEPTADAEAIDPAGLRTEFVTAAQLLEMPNPEPLINGVLDIDTTAWLIGKAGSYKSFIALDMLGHVALGKPWHGHQVRQGRGVYIVAEGVRGTKLRVAAWERTYGHLADAVMFLPRPVQVRNAGAWAALVAALVDLEPIFVVIDTQSRVAVGLEENSNTEMMTYVHAVDEIRRATAACVLTLHHQGRTGLDARGASSIDGAQDVELRIERDFDRHVILHMDKSKDSDDTALIDLDLVRIEGGIDEATGRDLSSLVVVTGGTTVNPRMKDWIDNLAPNQAAIIGVFADFVPNVGGTKADVRRLLKERVEMANSSFARAWDALVTTGIIEPISGSQRWVLTSMHAD